MGQEKTPEHITPAAQLGRAAKGLLLIRRSIERDVTREELLDAAGVMAMLQDDFRDRIAGRAPHPVTGRKRVMR